MKFGHPFLVWGKPLEAAMSNCFVMSSQSPSENETRNLEKLELTEQQIRRLHKRFGHPSVSKLGNLLDRAGYKDCRVILSEIVKHCELCQKHGPSPRRFKFSLRDDDCCFNQTIFVDVLFIEGKPVLHIVDEATRFQAAQFLKGQTTQDIWNALRQSLIDVYVGPPDLIVHDAGKNFTSKEMHQFAESIGSGTKCVPVEAHHSIGIVERQHAPLRRAFNVIQEDLKDQKLTKSSILQMAVKAINDTAGSNGITPTVLAWGTFQILTAHEQNPSIVARAKAIQKASIEVSKLRARKSVNAAINARNGPDTTPLHKLPLGSKVWVWRESGNWTGPYNLLEVDNENCIVQLPSGPTKFRSTSCKPFYTSNEIDHQNINANKTIETANLKNTQSHAHPIDNQNLTSKTNTLNSSTDTPRRNKPRERRLPERFRQFPTFPGIKPNTSTSPTDSPHFIKSRNDKIDFTESRKLEIQGLIEKGVFKIAHITEARNHRIFGSRFVDTIKNEGTVKAYKKSRMVVQGYNDDGKKTILTQAPTIQRISQRFILCLAAIHPNLNILLRYITQAYVQSVTNLSRKIFVKAPAEIGLDANQILLILKPLYGIPEAGNHWYHTYHKHFLQNLNMEESTYDSCLLYSTSRRSRNAGFGIVGMQTDDTLTLCDVAFAKLEEVEVKKAKLLAKPVEHLTKDHPINFNGSKISLAEDNSITLTQETQCKKINLIEHKDNIQAQYISQRALGAYVATVCLL
ncbi:hypothetical protein K3495_g12825 [Podosphaera aphanis]|nr:hypothetical protein K3495_g12825 [Podosphaera aphanis]